MSLTTDGSGVARSIIRDLLNHAAFADDGYAPGIAAVEAAEAYLGTSSNSALEWSATRQGPGSGPMCSGNDGRIIPACPVCGGIKPDSGWQGYFREEFVGHRTDCKYFPVSPANVAARVDEVAKPRPKRPTHVTLPIDRWSEICRELNKIHSQSSLSKANRELLDAIRQAPGNRWATDPKADDVDEPIEMTVGLLERLLNAAKSGAASAAWVDGCRSGTQSPWTS